MRKCLACGSDQISNGKLVSTGKHLFVYGTPIEFKSQGIKDSPIIGFACLNCGHLELAVKQEKLKPLTKNDIP